MSATRPLIVFGKPDCSDFLRTRSLLEYHSVPYEFRSIVDDATSAQEAARLSGGVRSPVIVLPDGAIEVEPSDDTMLAHLSHLGLITH